MQGLPSPASSPSLASYDNSSGLPTRKRQRSQSMQSDTSSSSPKRSVSSGIGSPPSDEKCPLSPSDRDIVAYMAEQGEADISLDSPTPNGINPNMLPPADKLLLVDNLRKKQMQAGDTWFVVSRSWYKRWHKACTGEMDKEGGVDEQDVGPVDNSPLVDKDGNLISSTIEGVDVEFVPKEVWSHFTTWYGQSAHPLPRKVIARGIIQEPSLELHPPRLKAFILSRDFNLEVATGPPPRYVCLSSKDSVKMLCKQLADAVSTQSHLPYRVWKVEGGDFDGSEYPPSKLLPGGATILEESDTTLEDALVESEDSFVVEFKEGVNWLVDVSPVLQPASSITLPSSVPPPLFSSGNDFFSRMESSISPTTTKVPSTNTGKDVPPKHSPSSSTALRPAASIDTFSFSGKGHEPGTLGLGNMGNTCFMNSALQCLAHNKELADYFLTGVYREELNPDNPLGMHGAIAEAFGALLRRIWSNSGLPSSYSPREFKQQLQRFAPQFSGYQQHDSQELVAFLLDGLHEDLNRVLKKPYVEKPDWEGGGDEELVHLARTSWEGYMKRNDSVIVDLFQGQYQSTLVCPECQKISITFDPFMYLTLPLPVQKKWRHSVFYVPWDSNKPHVKVPVEIGRDASFKDLRNLLGRWMGAQPDNLLTLEIFSHRFYKNLDDSVLCGEMSDNDVIVCFELPCHAQQNRPHKKQPGDPFIIPVFFCDVNLRHTFSRGASLFGYPSIVVIDQKQATTLDAIYNAVVDRLQRWTANARDLYRWEARSADSTETTNGFTFVNSMTEIMENGDFVTIREAEAEEGDIVDEKSVVIQEQDAMDITADEVPNKMGAKQGIFNLRLQTNHKDYGAGVGGLTNRHYESWENRLDAAPTHPVLLREGDAFFCEFDENMKAYYFGDELSCWEHARWDNWDQFIHPEYDEAKKASAEKKSKGISLQDCLNEFTKSEELGQDDLWYCPRCKKHQQATKKFDLWKAPDVLVVHLKRFSNSRTLRDKIDTFVDFPVQGLDLGDMVGERQVAKRLLAQGRNIAGLDLDNIDEPLVYDLFGVDEHLGGLGAGHYRAYALNHITEKWYHFDDSYVSSARPTDAVTANAYLLFYRRRTSEPLGGKTYVKTQEARLKPGSPVTAEPILVDNQLPTPPNEVYSSYLGSGLSRIATLSKKSFVTARTSGNEGWPTPRSNRSNAGSAGSSPPPLDDPDLPSFDSQFDEREPLDLLQIASNQFDFPDPSYKASPSSSIEAEPDLDYERDDSRWKRQLDDTFQLRSLDGFDRLQNSPEWNLKGLASPTGSSVSDLDPFSDANEQKKDDAGTGCQDIPINA